MTPPTPTEVEALALELEASGNFAGFTTFIDDARWILARFVRREKHERVVAHIESSHNEVVCSSTLRHADDGGDPVPLLTCMTWDSHCLRAEHERKCEEHVELQIEYTKLCAETSRLRAELRGQRCDGSGRLLVLNKEDGITYTYWCPLSGCPACKPDATPKADRCEHDWTSSSSGTPVCLKCNSDGSRDREVVSEAESDLPKGGASLDSAAPVITLKCRRCGRLAATEMYCAHCYVITKYAEGEEPPWLDDVLRAVEGMECLVMQAPAPAPVVHVVQLHEDTVRALAAIWNGERGPMLIEPVLAKLKEPKS